MPFSKIRTRIAPSPTGDPHVGTAYIALFNYCFAKKNGGQFILRVEDTDTARTSAGSEAVILRCLDWLGLRWDEGPTIGGPHAPYRQSERMEIYQKYANELLSAGHAFRCFCRPERLAEMREKQKTGGQRQGYDGQCLHLSPAEVQIRMATGEPSVIRLKVPDGGTTVVKDLLRGEIAIDWATVDMQVLVKTDGMPTYHLANVVDDHLMEISHIIRGEEWISSAPKHQLLYQYFGWEMPTLCHLPLLRNLDKSKLSKRKNPTSVLFYEKMGYLPEALLNYLGLMAWSLPSGEEKFSLTEMIAEFSLERVSLGGPIFDLKKLQWLNGRWIREGLNEREFAERVCLWKVNEEYLMQVAPLVQSRISLLSDLGTLTLPFFSGVIDITLDQILDGGLDRETVAMVLELTLERIEGLEWTKIEIETLFRTLAEQTSLSLRNLTRPFFVIVMGSSVSVPLFDGMQILGRDLCRERMRHAGGLVGKPQSKETKLRLKALRSSVQGDT